MASNQLLFALQCMHCIAHFFSQASLRAHTKHGPPKCRQYCIRCGCYRDRFLERERLTFHLNQPGINRRPAASSPSDFLTTETRHAATATTLVPNVGRGPARGREEGLERPGKTKMMGFYQLVPKY